MGDWFSVNLGDGMLAWTPLGRIADRVAMEIEHADSPAEMAAYVQHVSEGRLHCEVVVYFPPALAAVAEEFGAGRCSRPAPNGLSLLAGHDAAWSFHFPLSGC